MVIIRPMVPNSLGLDCLRCGGRLTAGHYCPEVACGCMALCTHCYQLCNDEERAAYNMIRLINFGVLDVG